MEMKYCMHCGSRLDEKYLMGEGMVPYCPDCGEFRFPVYRTAVSVIAVWTDFLTFSSSLAPKN